MGYQRRVHGELKLISYSQIAMSETEVKDPPQEEAPQDEAPPQDAPDAGEAQDEPQGNAPADPQPDQEAEGDNVDGEAEPQEGGEGEGEPQAEGEPAPEEDQEVPFYYDEAEVRAKQKEARDKKLAATKEKRQKDQEARAGRLAAKQEAVDAGKNIIELTRCYDCASHKWCTKHEEWRYEKYADLFIAAVNTELGPEWHVAVNCLHPVNKIGSFEVEFSGKNYFSKIERQIWPSMKIVVGKIKEASSGESSS